MAQKFDYTFKCFQGGKVNEVTYQTLIAKLDMGRELCLGRPMRDGGVPQALALKSVLERAYADDGLRIEIWHNGNQLI